MANTKRKVLIFAYDYPPRGWSGVQRTVKFVRYMPEYGWKPIVLAPSEWYFAVPSDHSFLDEVADATTIRTHSITRDDWLRLSNILWKALKPVLAPLGRDKAWLVEGLGWRLETLFFPDEGVTWLPYAVREGLRTIRIYRPEVVYATAPPFSTLISAWIVAKMSGLPLVVDLRDLWIDKPDRLIDGRIKKKIDGILEHLSLAGAAAIITTTRSGADLLRSRYPKKSERIYTIYNGYDENDFTSRLRRGPYNGNRDKLTISHVGSLYGDRSPEPFLKGLASFLKRDSAMQTALTVRFVGWVSSFRETFKKYEHLGVVAVEDPVEHQAALEIMRSSAVLLLIVPDGNQRVVYAKLFEYLASGRPILGILPLDGEVADILAKAGNAWIVRIGDYDAISKSLGEIFQRWRSGELIGETNKKYVKMFERRHLTSQLCEIFTSIADCQRMPV